MTRDDEEEAIREDGFRAGFAAAMQRAREEAERDAARLQALSAAPVHEVLTDVHRLVDERDALKRQVEGLTSQRTEANLRADQWEVEAESLRSQLEKAKAQATEAEATVDRMRWEARGAPQFGEEEIVKLCAHGRPVFLPCTHCERERAA